MGLSYKGHKIEKYKNPFVEDTANRFKNTYLIFSKDGVKCRSINTDMMYANWLDGIIKFKL